MHHTPQHVPMCVVSRADRQISTGLFELLNGYSLFPHLTLNCSVLLSPGLFSRLISLSNSFVSRFVGF